MKDLFLSIFKVSEERLKSPFIGTFVLSFIGFNWKPILVLLLSQQTIECRIDFIVNKYSQVENLICFPLIVSVISVAILPYLTWFFEYITLKSYKERNRNFYNIKIVDIDGRKRVSLSEIELENLKADYKEKADLNTQIDSLKNQLISAKDFSENMQKSVDNLADENNNLKLELAKKDTFIDRLRSEIRIKEIVNNEYYEDFNNTPKNTIIDFVRYFNQMNNLRDPNITLEALQYFLDRFIALGFVNLSSNSDRIGESRGEFYEITDKGLYFLRKANLEGYF